MTRTLRHGASQTDGMLRWKSNEAWPWDAGAIDIKKALGVWLLGPPGWRRLDIILPEHRWTLAADNDEVLQKWVKLLEDVAPEKPVSEIRNGWMEKKGAVGGGWKLRFFVLLSTHELLYFESDRSPKCKGVIDLKEALSCNTVASPDYNYEFSFEVVAPKRTWVLCPDDHAALNEWMNDIRPLIGGGKAKEERAPAGGKRRKSLTSTGNRSYEADEDGNVVSTNDGVVTLKAGWLEKRGEINTAWKNRYFVLSSDNPLKDINKANRTPPTAPCTAPRIPSDENDGARARMPPLDPSRRRCCGITRTMPKRGMRKLEGQSKSTFR